MSRNARKKSATDIYHIMLRGINKQKIFEKADDYKKMMQILNYCKEKSGFELFAYCFMPNHIHLLIKVGSEPLETIFRRFGAKYVYWFNTKYSRTGHLFQDRFKSEAVDNDEYFFMVLRYIHNNPVNAGMTKKPDEYVFSSYNDYINSCGITDRSKAMSMMTVKEFIRYHKEENKNTFLDISETSRVRLTNESAEEIICSTLNSYSIRDWEMLPNGEKHRIIKELKEKGVSIRQITALTGEKYSFVQKS